MEYSFAGTSNCKICKSLLGTTLRTRPRQHSTSGPTYPPLPAHARAGVVLHPKPKSFIFGPAQCVIESLDINVGECISTLQRTVVHEWKDGISCEGGLALPRDSRVSCGENMYMHIFVGEGRRRTVGLVVFACVSSPRRSTPKGQGVWLM